MKRLSQLLIFFLFAGLLSSCGSKSGLPQPDHIVIVIEENHGYNQIIGSENAPFINQIAQESALFTDAHGVVHPSQPNYLALFSGSVQGVKGDECLLDSTPYTTPNLGASLIKAGYTFTGYSETMPHAGYLPCNYEEVKGYSYARKHAPWVNWQGDKENGLDSATNQPLTSFPTDFSKLPTVSIVVPNQANDMHNTWLGGDSVTVQRSDKWLKDHLADYIEWAKTHNSLFILTFDEDNFTPVNNIVTLFIGEQVKPGKYPEKINHYNVLRTLEGFYNLPPSGPPTETPIKDIWK